LVRCAHKTQIQLTINRGKYFCKVTRIVAVLSEGFSDQEKAIPREAWLTKIMDSVLLRSFVEVDVTGWFHIGIEWIQEFLFKLPVNGHEMTEDIKAPIRTPQNFLFG